MLVHGHRPRRRGAAACRRISGTAPNRDLAEASYFAKYAGSSTLQELLVSKHHPHCIAWRGRVPTASRIVPCSPTHVYVYLTSS